MTRNCDGIINFNDLTGYVSKDLNSNKICDLNYSLDGDNYDYLPLFYICLENWQYSGWSSCYNSVQVRSAQDLNNCGTTFNRAVLSTPCSTGGGGSSGSGPSNSTMTNKTLEKNTVLKQWIYIAKNDTVIFELNRTDIDVAKITINVNVTVKNVGLKIIKHESKPSEIQRVPAANVYTYIEINKQMFKNTDINNTKITFRVNKTWIQKHNINKSTVRLNRFNNTWEVLPTKLVDERLTHLVYESDSPGFSVFAITGAVNIIPESEPYCTYNTTRCYGRFIQNCDGYEWIPVKECVYACYNGVCVEREYFEYFYEIIIIIVAIVVVVILIYFIWKNRKRIKSKIFKIRQIHGEDLFDKLSR